MTAMNAHFDAANLPRMIMEPGRSMVGDAGIIQAEVVLISTKSDVDPKRWVYLDCGKFNGLPEVILFQTLSDFWMLISLCRPWMRASSTSFALFTMEKQPGLSSSLDPLATAL